MVFVGSGYRFFVLIFSSMLHSTSVTMVPMAPGSHGLTGTNGAVVPLVHIVLELVVLAFCSFGTMAPWSVEPLYHGTNGTKVPWFRWDHRTRHRSVHRSAHRSVDRSVHRSAHRSVHSSSHRSAHWSARRSVPHSYHRMDRRPGVVCLPQKSVFLCVLKLSDENTWVISTRTAQHLRCLRMV